MILDENDLKKLPIEQRIEQCEYIIKNEKDQSMRWDAVWLTGELAREVGIGHIFERVRITNSNFGFYDTGQFSWFIDCQTDDIDLASGGGSAGFYYNYGTTLIGCVAFDIASDSTE